MDLVCSMDVIYNVLEEYLQEKQNVCLYLETVQRKRQNLEENSLGGSLLRSWECGESIKKRVLNSALV